MLQQIKVGESQAELVRSWIISSLSLIKLQLYRPEIPWRLFLLTHTTKAVYDSDLASLTDTVASLYTKEKVKRSVRKNPKQSHAVMTIIVRGSNRLPLMLPHPVMFINFLNMYKRYHKILIGGIKQYLVPYKAAMVWLWREYWRW